MKSIKYVFLVLIFLFNHQIHSASVSDSTLNPSDFSNPGKLSMPGILWFWHHTDMTPELIKDQMKEMYNAGFSGIMMFPYHSTPAYYTEEFYDLFGVVLREADKYGMSVWLTNDTNIPTGHGATKVVPGGRINERDTLGPRPDLRALMLHHVQQRIQGGKSINVKEIFPGIRDFPTVVRYSEGKLNARSTGSLIMNQGKNWKDYQFVLDVTPRNWAWDTLVPGNYINTEWMFRADKERNCGYSWALTDHTSLGKGVAALKKTIIVDGEVSREFEPVPLPITFSDSTFHVEMNITGDRIETSIDGKMVDVTIDNTYTRGTVGFYLPRWIKGTYDNITVVQESGDTLFFDNCDSNSKWRQWAPLADVQDVFSVAGVRLVNDNLLLEDHIDLTSLFNTGKNWEVPAGDWAIEYFMKKHDSKMPYNYPDLFNPATIRRHLMITYNEIVRRYPWALGSVFKGFWSDEPHSVLKNGEKVWSEEFVEKIRLSGVELQPVLISVFNDLGREGRCLRARYYQQVVEGWADPFAQLQGRWCKDHGLDFMTNPTCDSRPPSGAYNAGNGLQMNQWATAPGVDAIFGQILPGKKSLISRWASSSVNQTGRQYVLYEVFGGYGWDVTPNLVRYVNGYLNLRGCNRASYHAYWTNPEKIGFAPPFDPSNPWWKIQKNINLWNGRLQEVNLGKAVSSVALLNPVSTIYSCFGNLNIQLADSSFTKIYHKLEDNQVCFDLLDETTLNNNPVMSYKASAVNGGLRVGEQTYRMVILPRAQTLSLEALQTLERMVREGGVLVAAHLMPEEELEGRDKEMKELILKLFGEHPDAKLHPYGKGWTSYVKNEGELPEILNTTQLRTVTLEGKHPEIKVLKRNRRNATVYLIMNEGNHHSKVNVTFQENETPEIWNPEDGSQHLAPVYSDYGQGITLPLYLDAFQTKVIVFFKDGPMPSQVPHLTKSPLRILSVDFSSDQSISATIESGKTGVFPLVGSYNNESYQGIADLDELPEPIFLDSGWRLSFEGQDKIYRDVMTGSWTKYKPGYSGTASYENEFVIQRDNFKSDLKWYLDLGTVHEVAHIEINGNLLDALLWPPYRQDLTAYLKPGTNYIKVSVSNTLANKQGETLASGLLGPVCLRAVHSRKIELSKRNTSGYIPFIKTKLSTDPNGVLTTRFTYREIGDARLQMKIWYPPAWNYNKKKKLPAVVFFFGGGWYGGNIAQFDEIAPWLAERGMIVLAPEYRTHRDGVRVDKCLEDSKSAMRYVYTFASEIGIDRNRLAAGGRSAGGHLAAATAYSSGFNALGDDINQGCKPNALILFNPVIDNGPGGFRHQAVKEYWEDFSPLHNISDNPPPTIFFTADKDQYTPLETARKYKEISEQKGGRCKLVVYKGGVHGCPFKDSFYPVTLRETARFLVSIGYLSKKCLSDKCNL